MNIVIETATGAIAGRNDDPQFVAPDGYVAVAAPRGFVYEEAADWVFANGTLTHDAAAALVRRKAVEAITDLAEIDRSTGMSRLLRESLMVILGESAPATLKAAETKAAAARAKVAPMTQARAVELLTPIVQ